MAEEKIVTPDILLEFLEAACHQILYYRRLYPDSIYTKKKLYGVGIYVCDHPEIKEYILNVLNAVKELLRDDESSVKSVQINFLDSEKRPIEKFVFDILDLQNSDKEKDPYYIKTEEALRTICLKVSTIESYLEPLPEDSTFTVTIVTYESSHIGLSENQNYAHFPWIVEDEPIELKNKELLPLKTVKTECLSFQMYAVEDKKSKNLKTEEQPHTSKEKT